MHSKSIQQGIENSLNSKSKILISEHIYRYFSGRNIQGRRFRPFRLYPHLINTIPKTSQSIQYDDFLELCEVYARNGLFKKGYYLDVNEDSSVEVGLNEEQELKLKNKESFIFKHKGKEYLSWESISCQFTLTDKWQLDNNNVEYTTSELIESLKEIVPSRVMNEAKSMAKAKALDRINHANCSTQ